MTSKLTKRIAAPILMAVVASATLILDGCTTGSTAINDEQKVSSIQIGKSTTADVERLFGKPGGVQLDESGEQVWTYQSVKTNATAFIPFLNMTGDAIHENNISVRFNKKGVVKALGRGEHKM